MDKSRIKNVLGYDLTPRLPRVGHISTGERGPDGQPRPLGHFRFVPVPGMERLMDEWVQLFGTKPREFTGRVVRLDLRREIWGRSKSGRSYLLHVCDGEHVLMVFDRQSQKLVRAPEGTKCDRRKCKPTLRVDLIMDGFPGIVSMILAGVYSINEIVGADMAAGLEGKVIRFYMTDREITVTKKDGGKMRRTISVVHAWPESETEPETVDIVAEPDEAEIVVDVETGEILDDVEAETGEAMPGAADGAELPEYQTLDQAIADLWG